MNYVKTMLFLAALTAILLSLGYMMGGGPGVFVALVLSMGINAWTWWKSDQIALRSHQALAMTQASHPDVYRMTEQLAQAASLPMPALYLMMEDQPNAFATGRDPDHAAIALTQGLLDRMTPNEVAGVIAHELAHIKNRDTLIMTVAATVAGAISFLAQFALWFGRAGNRGAVNLIGLIIATALAPLAATLVQMLISRTREYAADREGAMICGNPLWLADALRALSNHSARADFESVERHPGTAHMFIVNPLAGRRFDSLFATHPPVDRRIAQLEAMVEDAPRSRRGSVPYVRRRR